MWAKLVSAPNQFLVVVAMDRALDEAYLEGGGSLCN
jgi:hypothetical protein